MARRPDFDPNRPLVAARGFIFAGIDYDAGDPFPDPAGPDRETFPLRLIRRQYEALAVNHVAEDQEAEDPIQMTGPLGGRYKITAPWLAEPLTIRGKVNAEKALKELREDGPPVGWIAGGSEVTVEESGGGWYSITAPWMDEPEKVQGADEARARHLEIHKAGAPEQVIEPVEFPANLVLVSIVDDKFEVTAPWLDAIETYDEEPDAVARQDEIRADGPPEDWEPTETEQAGDAGETTGEEGGGAADPAEDQTEAGASDNAAPAAS